MIELKYGDKIKIKRGKLKGKVFTVHQSANDWLMVEELPAKILSISSVEKVDDGVLKQIEEERIRG